MVTENDPLAEDEGPCTKCDKGWVTVLPAYAVHLYPDPPMDRLALLDTATAEAVHAELALKRAAAANSVYPCRNCNRPMFFRWAGGHFKLGHDVLGCAECIEVMGGARAAKRAAKAYADLTPRKDLE